MFVIAFDGLEHSGKTSTMKEIEKELFNLGFDVVEENPVRRAFRHLTFEEKLEVYNKMDVKEIVLSYIKSYRSLKSEVEEVNDVIYLLDRGLLSTLMKILCVERDRLGTNKLDRYILEKMYEIGPIENLVFVLDISGDKEEKFIKIKERHGNAFASNTYWPHVRNQIDIYESYLNEIVNYLKSEGVKVYFIKEKPLSEIKEEVLKIVKKYVLSDEF